MAIKAVIFDCFGVLVAAAEVTLFRAFPQYNDELLRLDMRANLGQIDKSQFLNSVAEVTGVEVKELVKHRYCNVDDRDRYMTVIEWAHQLKSSGRFKLGLLSNVGRGWLDNFLHENAIEGLFDQEILSYEERMAKPDPKIFKLMADRLGLKPDECVMIDDKPENIAGAKLAGMQGIVFTSCQQARSELDKILEA